MDPKEVAALRQAREYVYKLVFEYSFRKESDGRTKEMFLEVLPEESRPYLVNTFDQVIAHYDEMVELIMRYVKGYSSPDRLNRADLAVMVYACYELSFRKDIPTAVVIKEALELAKEYGGEKSSKFVNGVLGAIARDIR
jgi:N utilization substance protein B